MVITVQRPRPYRRIDEREDLAVMKKSSSAPLSQLYQYLRYRFERPRMQLDRAMFIVSIDVDVGSREVGTINKGANDANIQCNGSLSEYALGEIEERAFHLFDDVFTELQLPVTFALRGQITEVDDSILAFLLKSRVNHDIGFHGYYHRKFTDLTRDQADDELSRIQAGSHKFGVTPRSFIFPKNRVAHLDLLEKYEYKCYRGYGDYKENVMYIEKEGQLYNIHPSLYLNLSVIDTPLIMKKILGIAVAKKLPLHLWFHLWNFGTTDEAIAGYIDKVFLPLLRDVKRYETRGLLTVETMLSATETVEQRLDAT